MSDDTRIRRLAAAKLASRNNKHEEIAEILHVKRPAVSKWLHQCMKEGILKRSITFCEAGLTEDDIADIESLSDASVLLEDIQNKTSDAVPHLRRIRIYGSACNSRSSRLYRRRNTVFGRQIAHDVMELVLKSSYCMVAWGGLIGSIIDENRKTKSKGKLSKRRIEFYPVRGDPLDFFNVRTSPSVLCEELDAIVNGNSNEFVNSLAGVPAVAPSIAGKFDHPNQITVMREYAELSKAYRRIFGEGRERESVDCILTGVGTIAEGGRSPEHNFGLYTERCLDLWGVDSSWLSRHVIGDIAGVYIERPDLKGKQKEEFATKADLWLGAKLEDFQRCAKKGENGKPGVIVAVVGNESLGRVVFDCCTRLGIITELFIDYEMYKHLNKICRERE